MFLKYIGSTETIQDRSELSGVCNATRIRIRRQVTDAIITELLDPTIQWPNVGEYQNISAHFSASEQYNFPNVIGGVDESHIPISKPYENPDAFYDRRKFNSVFLHTVCREDMRFTDICVGYQGRMHDSTILKASDIWNTGMAKCQPCQYTIVADGAYKIISWLMAPYRDNGLLTNQQKLYNPCKPRRRTVTERAFGVLKTTV